MKNGRTLALLLLMVCLSPAINLAQEAMRPRVQTFVARANQPLFCQPLASGGYKARLKQGQRLGIKGTQGLWKEVQGEGLEGWVLTQARRRLGGADVSDAYLNSAVTATIGSGLVTKGFKKLYGRINQQSEEGPAALAGQLESRPYDMQEYEAFMVAGKLPVSAFVPAPSALNDSEEGASETSASEGAATEQPAQQAELSEPVLSVRDDLRAAANKKRSSMQMTQDEHYFSRNLSYEDERAIGYGVGVRLAEGRIHAGEELTEYIRLVGAAIVEKCDRADIPYQFIVLDGDEVNAFAAPGGYIFITTGCIRACRSEAELAGVLAHEVAHVARRHGLRIMDKNRLQIAKTISASELDRVLKKYTGGMDRETAETVRKLRGLADESYKYCTAGWGQEFELEADAYGLRYAHAVGWDFRGLFSFLETLGKGKQVSLGQAFSSHPSVPARIEGLEEVVRADGLRPSGVFLKERFVERCASVR
ncbi:MAG: hypothetical protein ACI8QZ_000904 [Chlamydiales bacterium]|jgi:hypothetical protein